MKIFREHRMNNSLFKTRAFLLVYGTADAGLVLYGVFALIRPNLLMEPFSTSVYQFPAEATVAISYLLGLFRLLGFLNLILGSAGLFFLWRYRVTRETWLSYGVAALSFLSYLGPIIFDNTVGQIGFFEVIEHVIFAALIISGLLFFTEKKNR
jgi:hypothetical protein